MNRIPILAFEHTPTFKFIFDIQYFYYLSLQDNLNKNNGMIFHKIAHYSIEHYHYKPFYCLYSQVNWDKNHIGKLYFAQLFLLQYKHMSFMYLNRGWNSPKGGLSCFNWVFKQLIHIHNKDFNSKLCTSVPKRYPNYIDNQLFS